MNSKEGLYGFSDEYLDILGRVGGFEKQELRLYDVGYFVAKLGAHEDDAVGYETRKYVDLAERHVAFLDDRACHIGDVAGILVESVAADAPVVYSVFPKFVVVCDDLHNDVYFYL